LAAILIVREYVKPVEAPQAPLARSYTSQSLMRSGKIAFLGSGDHCSEHQE
jgi:hypothetical protein